MLPLLRPRRPRDLGARLGEMIRFAYWRISGLVVAASVLCLGGAVVTQGSRGAVQSVEMKDSGGKIEVRLGGEKFTEYRYKGLARPILYPIIGPRGVTMTRNYPILKGVKGKAIWGKRAKWVDYWAPVGGKTVGVAIFDHPSNPRHPTWWHARAYGLVAANPFGVHNFERKPAGTGDMKIKAGQSVTFLYRFLFHEGDTKEAKIAERYKAFAKTKAVGESIGTSP